MAKAGSLKHLVLIPDGNRRWARSRKLTIHKGHQQGAKQFEQILETVEKEKVEYLTIWIASENNLTKRTKAEIRFLISLFKKYFKTLLKDPRLEEKQARIKIFGKGREIVSDKSLNKILDQLEAKTEKYKKYQLTFLFGYNGTTEMLEAIKKLKKSKKPVSEKNLRDNLWTGNLPDVDLVIRTGTEPHNSAGFMMWHCANSEYYFSKLLWPDFDSKELKKAIKEFNSRRRKMGK